MKLITLLLFLLPAIGFSQAFTFNQGGPVEKKYYAEIPYETVNGKIILAGEIAGRQHRFLLDTGAPVAISKDLATELNALQTGKTTIHDTFLHSDSIGIVKLNGITLGNITFNQIPAITLFPDFYKCYGVDGVIGSNLLRNSIISIDSKRHLIILTDQKNKLNLKSKNSTDLISNIGPQSDPQIKIVLKNKLTLTIPFDTGDNAFLRLNDKTINDLKQYALFDTLAKGYGSSGLSLLGLQEPATKYLYKVAPINIGNGSFINLAAESNKTAIPAIGSRILDYGIATLDFIHGKFYFDAYEPKVDVYEKRFPVTLVYTNNKLVIGVVWDKADPLLKQGQQIMEVDGVTCGVVTLCEMLTNKPVLEGKNKVVLTIVDSQQHIHKVPMTGE